MSDNKKQIAHYHLPGLFEFYDFYSRFLPLYRSHREYFYDWCDIGSIYGAPAHCLWGGGRLSEATCNPQAVFSLMKEYGISARLTFSNSLLKEEHLSDKRCNALCRLFAQAAAPRNGVIIHSDLLLHYLRTAYPDFYFISSTTKVLTEFSQFQAELNREAFSYVVPDFRLNKCFAELEKLPSYQKEKVEFLCNECCWINCQQRRECYENVSRKNLGEACQEHRCAAPDGKRGYRFSSAMENPSFISIEDIQNIYMPMHFSNFKIEGRSLGSALILEFLLYYMTKPDKQLKVREEIYLDNTLDLF